jgi:hypothetical protein
MAVLWEIGALQEICPHNSPPDVVNEAAMAGVLLGALYDRLSNLSG